MSSSDDVGERLVLGDHLLERPRVRVVRRAVRHVAAQAQPFQPLDHARRHGLGAGGDAHHVRDGGDARQRHLRAA
jgi:hypothetical protein